jgi:hypothetical protein
MQPTRLCHWSHSKRPITVDSTPSINCYTTQLKHPVTLTANSLNNHLQSKKLHFMGAEIRTRTMLLS